MKEDHYDRLIVGSGAGGAPAAWNLSNIGLKVACFEQGEEINKSQLIKDNLWEYVRQTKYSSNPNKRNLKSDYPIDNNNSPISIANFNGVGGSTFLYSAHLPRFRSNDFKIKSFDNVGCDWPINYKDLKKFYELNEKIIGIAGKIGDPAYPDIKNLLKPVKLENSGKIISKGFKKLGWHFWPSYSGIVTSKFKNRKINSLSDMNNSYWPLAIKNGVDLYTNTRVSKIKIDKKGYASGVYYFNKNNIEKFQSATIIILACGGIGTPRILLNSKTKKFKDGIANSSGLVGKNLMLHPLGFVEGSFKNLKDSFKGPEGCNIYSHNFHGKNKYTKFNRGYTIQVLRGDNPISAALSSYKFKELRFGKNHHKQFAQNYGNKIPIAIICEDLPQKQNFIELDNKRKDYNGIPGVKINYMLSKNSKKMLAHGLKKGKELMEASGSKKTIAYGPVKHTGWHIMGTAKMGKKKTNSVVNSFGQTHDVKNLYIVDSSIFSTSSSVNPVNTIISLSLMITDGIKKDYLKNQK